jgi:hypothetical protein
MRVGSTDFLESQASQKSGCKADPKSFLVNLPTLSTNPKRFLHNSTHFRKLENFKKESLFDKFHVISFGSFESVF